MGQGGVRDKAATQRGVAAGLRRPRWAAMWRGGDGSGRPRPAPGPSEEPNPITYNLTSLHYLQVGHDQNFFFRQVKNPIQLFHGEGTRWAPPPPPKFPGRASTAPNLSPSPPIAASDGPSSTDTYTFTFFSFCSQPFSPPPNQASCTSSFVFFSFFTTFLTSYTHASWTSIFKPATSTKNSITPNGTPTANMCTTNKLCK